MMTGYLNPFPLPPIEWALPEGERRSQARWGLDRVLGGIQAGEDVGRIARGLEHLPDAVIHDVVAGLAEQVAALAERERAAWRGLDAAVRAQRPASADDERVARWLASAAGGQAESPDELITVLGEAGPALTAPALTAIRAAFKAARDAAHAAGSERERNIRLINRLVYRFYQLSADDIAVVEGRADGAGSAKDEQRPAERTKRGRGQAAAEPRDGEESQVRTVTRGGRPDLIVACVRQALANPYGGEREMNEALGYSPTSAAGSSFLAMAWLAGLVTKIERGWLRATAAGRGLLPGAHADPNALWHALVALPAYRRELEHQLLDLPRTNSARSVGIGSQVERAIAGAFPGFQRRVEYLTGLLPSDDEVSDGRAAHPHPESTLEPIARSGLESWIEAQGLGRSLSDLTRARAIAEVLAAAETEPLGLDAAWLDPAQMLVLVLLAAARERGQGVVIQRDEPTLLSSWVGEMQRGGVEIRIEPHGVGQAAMLVPAVALHLGSLAPLDHAAAGTDTVRSAIARAALEAARVRTGLDGQARGAIALDDLGLALSQSWSLQLGELVSHGAADQVADARSNITVGGPLPLAPDLVTEGRPYRFFDEALRAQARGERPGVAALLSQWLVRQDGVAPADLLAIHPHLALLYLVAADSPGQSEALVERGDGWRLDDRPVVAALDDGLRALGYEVWDDGYRDDGEATRQLGDALVEQGLRAGVLERGRQDPTRLDAPTTYGYYAAQNLLSARAITGRTR